jgi:hypothetical protein
VSLDSSHHSLVLKDEIVTKDVQHDLDDLGIAKTAREEKQRARAERLRQTEEHERMMKLYRQYVLKEPETPDARLVQLSVSKTKDEVSPAGFGD